MEEVDERWEKVLVQMEAGCWCDDLHSKHFLLTLIQQLCPFQHHGCATLHLTHSLHSVEVKSLMYNQRLFATVSPQKIIRRKHSTHRCADIYEAEHSTSAKEA